MEGPGPWEAEASFPVSLLVAGRMMAPPRCPHRDPQNLQVYYVAEGAKGSRWNEGCQSADLEMGGASWMTQVGPA